MSGNTIPLYCLNIYVCVHSSFAIFLKRKRKLVALLFFVIQMYCYYQYSVTLPHSVVGWSAVCDFGIS